MLLHSCATLQYSNSVLLQAAVAKAVDQLGEFTPQGVSNMVWACAKLGHFSTALVEGALGYFNENSSKFKPQETCNLLWSLTHQRYHPRVGVACG